MSSEYVEANRTLWERWTELHVQAATGYHQEVEKLLAGESTLDENELAELGDIAGKRLLHLQCHLGHDTLSLAKLGATATGVDWTERAIAYAQSLSQRLKIPAEFVCSDLYGLPAVLDRQFDIVYTSGGVLPWLPDLGQWAEIVAHFLKPGGMAYVRESHPIRHLLGPRRLDAFGKPIEMGYFSRLEPTPVQERGSYGVPEAEGMYTAYYWTHGLGEIITALCTAGLRIEYLHEFPKMVETSYTYEETASGEFVRRSLHNIAIPRAFSIGATR